MSKPTNIHDSFFKNVLSDREAADIFLREHLPREVVDLLAPGLPELMPGSFVDEILGPEALREALQRLMPDQAEEIMQGFGQKYFEEGIAVGEARGKAGALMRLLERRIGAVPEALRARLFAADLESIETWFDRAIDATEFESVFGRN